MLKRLFREHGRHRPSELAFGLKSVAPGDLEREIVDLFAAGELRLHSRKQRLPLCQRFDKYDKTNQHVGRWFLAGAQALKQEEHRKRYSFRALIERIRWEMQLGIIKMDSFRISNDLQSCYVRQVLMRDPSLCGLFEVKRNSQADALVVDGCSWTDFAKEHEAELWPKQTAKKQVTTAGQSERPLSVTA